MVPEHPDKGTAKPFRLGEWVVQPSLNRLSRGEESVQLEPKVMQVLVCLCRHAGEVVPRRQLVDAVWQTEFIADNTLTHAISDLRRVLGDEAQAPRAIETITRRGYRLVLPVEELEAEPARDTSRGVGCVVVVDGVPVVLALGDNLIGRSADVVVPVRHTEVSRHHARIVVTADGATLEDLGSKNGTYLWGEHIDAPTRLEHGDEIAIGPSLLTFRVVSGAGTTQTAGATDQDTSMAEVSTPDHE